MKNQIMNYRPRIWRLYPESDFARYMNSLTENNIEHYIWNSKLVENGVTVRTQFTIVEYNDKGEYVSSIFNQKGNW